MNIYSGGLHDDLQLFPEWDLAVTYFHHNFDEVVNSEACTSSHQVYTQVSPPPTNNLHLLHSKSGQKEPLLTKKLPLFHKFL